MIHHVLASIWGKRFRNPPGYFVHQIGEIGHVIWWEQACFMLFMGEDDDYYY